MELNQETLFALFQKVNQKYFKNQLVIKEFRLISPHQLYLLHPCHYRLWAVCDPIQGIIYLNENIERLIHRMPKYVLEYLIFHECIHFLYITHCKSFEEKEAAFPKQKKANRWLFNNDERIMAG